MWELTYVTFHQQLSMTAVALFPLVRLKRHALSQVERLKIEKCRHDDFDTIWRAQRE